MHQEKQIKTSVASEEMAEQKENQALNGEMANFFENRDKTNRGGDGKIEDVVAISKAEQEVKEMLYNSSMEDHPLPEGVQPMFNTLFLTARRNKITTESGLILTNSMLDSTLETDYQEEQLVMAHGPQAQQAFTGSHVVLNFEAFRKYGEKLAESVNKESRLEIPTVMIGDVEYLKVSERDLQYISKSVKNPNE